MGKFMEYLRESKVSWTIEKFENEETYKSGKSYAKSNFDGNVMLNAGITVLLQLLATNDAPNQYNNANAQIGVGDTSIPAANPAQTGLQALTNKAYAAMVSGYPTVVDQTVTFKASFAAGEGNFDWREFVVINSAGVGTIALNRKVDNQGTKIVGQVWEITLAITLA
jgi:hypothetical protein